MKNKVLILCAIAVAATVIWFVFFGGRVAAPTAKSGEDSTAAEESGFNKSLHSTEQVDSIWLVANKNRPIDTSYVPVDLVDVNVVKRDDKSDEELSLRQEAATAVESMFAAASTDGVNLMLGSAYRSSTLQETYYNNYVKIYGQEEADKFSAKSGTSEHQIGLSADVSGIDKKCYLEICFADTPEGQWLAANAHKHGFIIRYLEGKEDITGYQYEPWHVRYVGIELAKEIQNSGQTMEEFFEL